MAVKVPITVEGNLGADPEFGTKDDRAYARLVIVENDRRRNEQTDQWESVGAPVFHNAVVFGRQAENVARSLQEGDRVIVTGDLHFKPYEKDGQRRQSVQIIATAVGPSLRYGSAQVDRAPKTTGPEVVSTGPVATTEASWPVAHIAP